MMRRGAGVLMAAVAMSVVTAGPALADPARPTNYDSEVTAIEPEVPGFTAEVTGGDAFLAITVEEGTAVVVPGYRQEPYVRVDADGTVYENINSPAYWLNDDRFGQSEVPAEATPEAEPEWRQVADGGEWAWHDHRIHWMSPDVPPSVGGEGTDEVFTWAVPVEVDGRRAEVSGVLTWHPSQAPVIGVIVLLAAGVGAVIAGRLGVVATGIVVAAGGALALLVALAQASATPPGAGGEIVTQGAAAAATLGGAVTALLGRRLTAVGDLPAVVGAVLLVVWGLQRVAALWMPVLPSPLPTTVERVVVAAALGAAAGVAIAGFMRRLGGASPPAT